LAASVELVFSSDESKTAFEVFNVGDTNENYQKKGIADAIKNQLPDAKILYESRLEDPRDYRVNFDKIKQQLGFNITRRLDDGISEIKKAVEDGFILHPDAEAYRNS